MTVTCLDCDTPFARKKRGPIAHFCTGCRSGFKRTADRERLQQKRVDVDSATRLFQTAIPDVEREQLAHRLSIEDGASIMVEKPLEGARTPAGPEVGTTTEFRDFRGWLEAQETSISLHRWFLDNPHWAYELDRPAASVARLRRIYPHLVA